MVIAAWCAMRMTVSRDHGGTLVPPDRREGLGGRRPRAGRWGNLVSPPPAPGKVRAQPLRRGLGKPRFPQTPGRVWAGAALPGITFLHPIAVRRSGATAPWRGGSEGLRPSERLEIRRWPQAPPPGRRRKVARSIHPLAARLRKRSVCKIFEKPLRTVLPDR